MRGGPPPRPDLEQRVEQIMHQYGLPRDGAVRVAHGATTVDQEIERLALQDEVQRLMTEHNLNRALATQIARAQISLELVLSRRRIAEHLDNGRNRCVLEEAVTSGQELTLGLHGHRIVRAQVKAVEKYEVVLKNLDTNEEERVHKLQIKFAYSSAELKKVKKAMTWDKVRKERTVEPVTRPQDRYACSDRRLGLAWDRKQDVTAVLLEGECFTGAVSWVSHYEFGLRGRHGGEVTIFRHALDDFRDNT